MARSTGSILEGGIARRRSSRGTSGAKEEERRDPQPSPLIRCGHVHHVCSIVIVDTQKKDLWSTLSEMYPPVASSRVVLLVMFVVFGWMVEVPRASEILERGLRLKTGRFGRRMLKIAGALRMALRRKKRDGKISKIFHLLPHFRFFDSSYYFTKLQVRETH